jgi:hypothetical protein
MVGGILVTSANGRLASLMTFVATFAFIGFTRISGG